MQHNCGTSTPCIFFLMCFTFEQSYPDSRDQITVVATYVGQSWSSSLGLVSSKKTAVYEHKRAPWSEMKQSKHKQLRDWF